MIRSTLSPLHARSVQLRSEASMHTVAAVLLIVPLYLVTWLFSFLCLWSTGTAWLCALGIVSTLLFIGWMLHRKEADEERRAYDLPFETWTGSTYAVNKAVNRVLGPAYLVNEVIMGCVAQAFKAAGKRRLADLLDRVDRAEAEALFAALRARGTMPRFHPLRDFVAYERILAPLVAADLVWFKQEDGPATIGLNRAYD